MSNNIHKNGIQIERNFVSSSIIEKIKSEVKNADEVESKSGGIRSANQKFKRIDELSKSNKFIKLASSILGSNPEIARVIYFDKTPEKNWSVTWHQDKTIAVNKKIEIDGWSAWSVKDNINHVQPPLEVLNKMVTFRLHLDNAEKNNGCLKVIPDSHSLGMLSPAELTHIVNNKEAYLCEAKAGDLVIMRPHIIHSSAKSLKPKHRRVIHIEYSNYPLPSNLKWA